MFPPDVYIITPWWDLDRNFVRKKWGTQPVPHHHRSVAPGLLEPGQALAEILRYRGIRTIPFSFPYDRDREVLQREIRRLQSCLKKSNNLILLTIVKEGG